MSSSPPLVVADRYRLVAPLGQGGMGRVWRATDVVLHRDVAIKELVPPPGLTPGERQEMRERSLREARAIARLNNINVVRVFDVLRTDADPWIVMEYVASRSLQDTLAADGPFNAVRAAEIGLGVLNALRAAHRAGVVHRDVKPGNVLLGADGRVVLTDFGLATVPGDPNVTRTGLVLGSPAYIAPERARDGTAGPAADLWSLGATLFAAVEGQSPFARPSAIATLAALATENVPPSRNAGPLKAVLNGLLRKDPAHRIDAEEAERLLARAAGKRGRVTLPMSPTMRRPGVGRERPSLPSGPGGPPVLPGSGYGTGAAPVVPGPRPPVKAGPPPAGRPAFAQGKAPVGGPAPADPPRPARPGNKPLDATRVDSPAVPDETKPLSGTGYQHPAAPRGGVTPGRATAAVPQSGGQSPAAPVSPARVGFTAADVAANRRKKAAPEHERSLAAATGAFPIITPDQSAQATTVVPPTAAQAEATTVMPAGAAPADATRVVSQPAAKPSEADQATTVMPKGAGSAESAAEPAATVPPVAEPPVAESAAAVPPVTEAAVAVPAKTDSPTAEPPAAEPGKAEAEPGKAELVKAEPVKAEPVKAELVEAEPVEAATAEAEPAKAEPVAAQPVTKPVTAAAKPAPVVEKPSDTPGVETISPAPKTPADAKTEAAKTEPAEPVAEDSEPARHEPAKAEPPRAEPEPPAPIAPEPPAPVAAEPPVAPEKPAPEKAAPAEPDADKTSYVDLTAVVPPQPSDSETRVVGDLRTVPGFAPSNRPAWTPMAGRPTRRNGGITVFGTTLTRRQAAVGLGIVLAFVLLVGIVLVQAFSDDSGTPSAGPTKAAVTGQPAPAQGGIGGDKKPSSAAPSSAAPSSTGSAGIPDGWRTYKASGFSFPVPGSVKGGGGGSGLSLKWNNRMVRVDVIDAPLGNPVKFIEEQRTNHYGSYQRIGITEVDYHGKAADWEFTYRTDTGNGQHVVRRAFAIDDTTYILSWYTSPEDWDKSQKDWQAIAAGFAKR